MLSEYQKVMALAVPSVENNVPIWNASKPRPSAYAGKMLKIRLVTMLYITMTR